MTLQDTWWSWRMCDDLAVYLMILLSTRWSSRSDDSAAYPMIPQHMWRFCKILCIILQSICKYCNICHSLAWCFMINQGIWWSSVYLMIPQTIWWFCQLSDHIQNIWWSCRISDDATEYLISLQNIWWFRRLSDDPSEYLMILQTIWCSYRISDNSAEYLMILQNIR